MDKRHNQHLKELRQIYHKRLEILQKQAAGFGMYAPPHILMEIEDIKHKIADIDLQLSDVKLSGRRSSQKAPAIDRKNDLHANYFIKSGEYVSLHENLTAYFSDEDIRTLCFFLNIDYDNLPSPGKANKVRDLIMYCIRNECLEQLKGKCKELRPKVNWD